MIEPQILLLPTRIHSTFLSHCRSSAKDDLRILSLPLECNLLLFEQTFRLTRQMPSYNASQRAAIAQFVSFTQAKESIAARVSTYRLENKFRAIDKAERY